MKLYVSHPVFSMSDIVKTAEYYSEKLGFHEKHICLYCDDAEFILTQSNGQRVIPNREL